MRATGHSHNHKHSYNQTLLMISAGLEAVPAIKLAKEMGLHVLVSDMNPKAPGVALADEVIIASTYDVEATVSAARHYQKTIQPINGVMCVAADVPLTVASVARELGLSGISLESALLASDKLAMKEKFLHDNVPVPWFRPVESGQDLTRIVVEKGYPLVIKPVDSRGARGVLLLNPGVDLEWAYQFARAYSPTGRIMVEEFLPGPQVSTESILLDGVAYTPGFSDRNYEYLERFAPHIIENGGDLPSFLPLSVQQDIRAVVQQAALSMGIRDGVVKGDIVFCQGKPYLIELAARLSGGYFCTHEIPLNTGVDLVRQAIRLALGEKPKPYDLTPKFNHGVAQRYLFPKPGRVTGISGVEEVTTSPGIALCEIRVKVSDIIGPVDSHPARSGVIIAVDETREQAIERAGQAVSKICIKTESC